MNEEIDIIELLQRVKEGKAPKRIEIDGEICTFNGNKDISRMYYDSISEDWLIVKDITFDTKIKILDKIIIEELKEIQYSEVKYSNHIDQDCINSLIVSNRDKINEIIKWINNRGC